ncbi:hypothetical protein GE061_005269 [Apolygus lucorum]|uniref:Uncharacterized protein n=1 Tax=Apolygus lucorum TaxID=248454 RepID=A0A6A4INI5_APOLU|nr:hypothetical protein GE061_005269 [Apolygus lucorum]
MIVNDFPSSLLRSSVLRMLSAWRGTQEVLTPLAMELGEVNFDFNELQLDSFLDKCSNSWTCPLCAEKGVTARVRLYQANARQAIYFCETKDCIYPQTDESDPVVVNRNLLEIPVDAQTLEKFGFPPSMLDEGELTFKTLHELCLIHDAYKEYDDWARLENELKSLKNILDKEYHQKRILENFDIKPESTPIHYLRVMPPELIKYVKHFIPNIVDILELLKLDIL